MGNPSITDWSIEKFEPAIYLTAAQRSQLREALLSAGKPSSQASMLPRLKNQRKRKRVKKMASDHFLTLTGIV